MKNKTTRAQSLVEFAILLPIFLLVVVGIFDLGRVIYTLSALHNAAREGARYGAVHPCDASGIENTAQHFAVGLGEGVTVTSAFINMDGDEYPDKIQVTLFFEFRTVTPLVGVFLGEDGMVTLNSMSIQHIEQPTTC
jgi:hypothetical protein